MNKGAGGGGGELTPEIVAILNDRWNTVSTEGGLGIGTIPALYGYFVYRFMLDNWV